MLLVVSDEIKLDAVGALAILAPPRHKHGTRHAYLMYVVEH